MATMITDPITGEDCPHGSAEHRRMMWRWTLLRATCAGKSEKQIWDWLGTVDGRCWVDAEHVRWRKEADQMQSVKEIDFKATEGA